MSKLYSIFDQPTYAEKKRGIVLGSCITDGDDREAVIDTASGYFEERAVEDGEYGKGERDLILVTTDDNDDELIEEITVEWHAVRDTSADDVRFDYLVAIGAI